MMKQSILVSMLFCYATIAAIIARPLPRGPVKREVSSFQWEDVQRSGIGDQPEEAATDIKFYDSSQNSHIVTWPDGIIPYVFAKEFRAEHRKVAKKAMEVWSKNTCIRFQRLKSGDEKPWDHVIIQYSDVSNSYVGIRPKDFQSRGQLLNIKQSQGGILRLYLHEFGHLIGFEHEHSRNDRDDYVKIIKENIKAGAAIRHNFEKLNYKKETDYDYLSIMHYAVTDYAVQKNKQTIEILNPQNISFETRHIGTKNKLSALDIKWTNKVYACVVPKLDQPTPRNYKQFKVKLAYIPETLPADGHVTSKQYLSCDNESCVHSNSQAEIVITKLYNNADGLRIGDKVLLSPHKWSAKRGEWIICEHNACYSSRSCFNASYNESIGDVNFAFNKSGCQEQILTVSSKTLQKDTPVTLQDKIILQYSDNHRGTQEWLGCEESGPCKRKSCKEKERLNNTNPVRHNNSRSCSEETDEFEASSV